MFVLSQINTSQHLRMVVDGTGSPFFSKETMKFFNSRLLPGVTALDSPETKTGNRFVFITSEKYDDFPRHYNVRLLTLERSKDNIPKTDIDIIAECGSSDEARKFVLEYAKNFKGENVR